jgi:hypothetical protein
MNGGIIEAAVTDKTLRLELEYRRPTRFRDGRTRTEETSIVSGLAVPYAITEARSSLLAN